ncbi:MAG: hypothetical protein ACLQU4_17370 [Limisphaerales bacterium]
MRSRIFFGLIAGFWLAMNFLLWRSQMLAHSQIGSAIPVEIVLDKILTAPDNSSLEIYNHGERTGFCQWMVTAGGAAQALNQSLSRDYAPDGLTPQPAGYGLSLDGNAAIFGTNRVRFEMQLRLSTNQTWQEFRLTAKMPPTIWDVRASAAARKILVKANDDGGGWQTTVDFSDFDHPETLLREFGGEDLAGLAAVLPLQKDSITQAAAGIRWTAHEDWLQLGHSKMRVYRLETEILGQRISIFASRAGEILWVEAPNQLTLRNEAFSHL